METTNKKGDWLTNSLAQQPYINIVQRNFITKQNIFYHEKDTYCNSNAIH